LAQTGESWLKYERNGKGYGYDHIVAQRLDNGEIKYQVDQHIKTDIAGFNPQDITQKGFYIVDRAMNPVSIDLHIKFHTKKIIVKGNCLNGIMYLTKIDETEKSLDYEIPFQDVYFEIVLGKLIFHRKDEKNFVLKLFNPIELKTNEYYVRINRQDENGMEATIKERISMHYQFDKNGRIKKIDFVETNTCSYPTDAVNAQNIDYINTADGLTLTVRSKKMFPNVFKVNRANIQINWKDIPFNEFCFRDNRQKAVKKEEINGEYKAVIKFESPFPLTKKLKIPKKKEKFASFLADTEFIKPSDDSIRKKLAEIRGEEKDPFLLVRKLLLWVYSHVKTEYIAETLSGPEVLQKKRGKCSEYTTLFASLSRAAGIPTRIAFGEATNGKNWVGHLWCEVWLGEWIAVDAAAGIFINSPSHIKLIDSPTLMGTQKVRWKLVDNLEIDVLDFKEY
jgi:hypothetical protein